jgi:ATP-dependent 26S proteasome regulatory subunit
MCYCILPLFSQAIRSRIHNDDIIRSILFYGPEGCGKASMSLAVASMANAMVINMSPNQLNSYIDKPVEATKLVHMIFSVAMDPSYAPVVILIDECEKIFAKKKKGQSSGLTIFLKDLLTYKNQALTKQDRVIIIGCTSSPELADISILKWKGNMGKPYKQGKMLSLKD